MCERNEANELIERAEREGGGSLDDPNSNAMFILFGMMARKMNMNQHKPEDDMVAGMRIIHDMKKPNSAYIEGMVASMFQSGLDPAAVNDLTGKLNNK